MAGAANIEKIKYFIEHYGRSGVEDQRVVEEFFECETAEMVNPLKAQLMQVAQGGIENRILDQIIGKKRQLKHGSYEKWAKLMLLWMSKHKQS
ncbi:MAG: hypothetical protein D6719_08330 [Candidatus Dadabacteria bacterium]|nr:MAG: hypothetical protein D6719_08330 [Candidatus Dadabacteria bacterium]